MLVDEEKKMDEENLNFFLLSEIKINISFFGGVGGGWEGYSGGVGNIDFKKENFFLGFGDG